MRLNALIDAKIEIWHRDGQRFIILVQIKTPKHHISAFAFLFEEKRDFQRNFWSSRSRLHLERNKMKEYEKNGKDVMQIISIFYLWDNNV
jgi:hypothetical protein